MKKSMKLSVILIVVGFFMIAIGILFLSLAITDWDAWIRQLTLTGMTIIIIISVLLIIIGVFFIIKFLT